MLMVLVVAALDVAAPVLLGLGAGVAGLAGVTGLPGVTGLEG